MNCRRIRKRFAAYRDGEIGAEDRDRISAHLEECPSCRRFHAELEQVWKTLGEIPEIEVSGGFERRLFSKIHVPADPRPRWRFPWISWVYRAYPAPAMAAIVLLVGMALGGYLGNTLVSGFTTGPAQVRALREETDIVSFRVFSAVPPGTLGDGYVRMVHFTEDRK